MNRQIVKFKPEHMRQIKDIQHENTALAMVVSDEYLDHLSNSGTAYTCIDDNGPLACFGVFPLWQGVGETWMFVSRRVQQRPVTAYRVAFWFCKQAAEQFHRIQTATESDDIRAKQFLENIGFRYEGQMPAYGPTGKDYDRYARVTH